MKRVWLWLSITIACVTFGCDAEKKFREDQPVLGQMDELHTAFAKILAPALADNIELRELIKSEALKQFDNDYDVLYHHIRDLEINGETVSEILQDYAESPEQFNLIENQLPLLTIFVPELPSGFSADSWNVNTEIPKVAVALPQAEIPFYDGYGNKTIIPKGRIPGFPIVIIKENERVEVNRLKLMAAKSDGADAHNFDSNINIGVSEKKFSFNFIDDAFNGLAPPFIGSPAPSPIDQIIATARNLRSSDPSFWDRDYIYYNLSPNRGKGALRRNYREHIVNFRLNSPDWLFSISDQPGDPTLPLLDFDRPPSWTDGLLEFKIITLYNAKDGTGNTITKFINAKATDLVNVTYMKDDNMSFIADLYVVINVTIKNYKLPKPLEIATWDLRNYGTAWKFIIYEVDPSQNVTVTESHATTYGTNFDVDTKIGLKFGGKKTTSSTKTISITTKKESDFLGEAVLHFYDPVLVTSNNSGIRDISTGKCSLGIMPIKIY